ncbi:division/cell wall cluster transcriptional repressor MraZ [Thalassospiraceae bacterium LMO-JJ14]|nr:division/cell wall cluster transcriptional repressor MraZ [Thalassospiraceae bacterium LMO-JJ14]
MGVFTGTQTNKVDKKGRVSVPKTFRALFEGEGFQGVFVFPSFRQPALEACAESFMERIVDSLEDLPMFSDEQDDLSIIVESAQRLSFDTEGRIIIPEDFLGEVGIKDEITFVGRGRTFQMWAPGTYKDTRKPAFERARTCGLTLKLRRPSQAGNGGEG